MKPLPCPPPSRPAVVYVMPRQRPGEGALRLGNNVAAAMLLCGVAAAFLPPVLPLFLVAAPLGLLTLLACGLAAMLRGRLIRGAILAGVPLALAGLILLARVLR